MGRLVEHHGPYLAGQFLQRGAALLFAGGQEALEGEPPRVQPRHSQGRDGGAAAGDGLYRHAVSGAQGHQILAGVADGGGARIRHQCAGLTLQQAGQNGLPCGGAVMLVVADQRLPDVEVVQQLYGHAGVLGGDEIRPGQRLHGTGGKVSQIADGRGHQI